MIWKSHIPKVQAKLTKEDYLQAVEKLQAHIQRGDIYEVNFCQEYFAEEVTLNPLTTFNIYMLFRNLLLLVIIVMKIVI